ncbi:MAG: DUF6544 family protein [Bacteroidota bacterium]
MYSGIEKSAGALINFISEDMYYTTPDNKLKKYPWSTPILEYGVQKGWRLPSVGKAIWHVPVGEFCCLELKIKNAVYNVVTHSLLIRPKFLLTACLFVYRFIK